MGASSLAPIVAQVFKGGDNGCLVCLRAKDLQISSADIRINPCVYAAFHTDGCGDEGLRQTDRR